MEGSRMNAQANPLRLGQGAVSVASSFPFQADASCGKLAFSGNTVSAPSLWPVELFNELDVSLDPEAKVLWSHMRPDGPPSFTRGLLHDIAGVQQVIADLFDAAAPDAPPLHYYVLASRLDGIFNLGGHLGYFADCIRRQDRPALLQYGHDCISVLHNNAMAFGLPVITIALVQGDALGGGFEAALSCDLIIAERGTKFGLPEILFNLFPGMGAYSFLSRRVGPMRAEQMIFSGRLYTAEELHEMGLVTVLADVGTGEAVARKYIRDNDRRRASHRSIYDVRRAVNPLDFAELEKIVNIWVDNALEIEGIDLRKMERLVAAQERRTKLAALRAG
jgi:DSF synthase